VCLPGYGGSSAGSTTCGVCAAGTFSAGGGPAGQTCTGCAAGTTSAPGATSADECHPELEAPNSDYFMLSSSDKWTNLTLNATAGVTCMSLMEACRNSSTCIQMRVANDYTSCQMYSSDPSGSTTFSYKVGLGMDYVRYKITGADLANVIATPAASTLAGCEFACSASQNCEGVMFTASSQQLSPWLHPSWMERTWVSCMCGPTTWSATWLAMPHCP